MTKCTFYGIVLQSVLVGLLMANDGKGQHAKLNETFVSLNLEGESLKDVFLEIQTETGFNFLYKKSLLRMANVSVYANNKSLESVLRDLSKRTGITFKRINENIYVRKNKNSQPELVDIVEEQFYDIEVSGKVTDQAGEGLPGVNIVVKNSEIGTITDVNGLFNINVDENAILVFSYVGYEAMEVPVNGQNVLNVKLTVDTEVLSEVVVTAFGLERDKKSLGYAVTEVDGDEISEAKEVNFVNSLSGKVAGLQISQTNGGPGSSTRVVIRGNSSLLGNNQALFIVDGVPINNSADGEDADFAGNRDYGSPIQDINPENIESVTVLKGPNAAALYGTRAANGVIVVTTKKGEAKKGIGIQFTSNATFENPLIDVDFQNEYGQGRFDGTESIHDISATQSWGPKLDGSSVQRFDGGGNVPYVASGNDIKNYFRTGKTFTNSISLDGGNNDVNYRLSYTNLTNASINPGSSFDRHNFLVRVGAQITDKLSVDGKVNYIKTDAINRIEFARSRFNPIQGLLLKPRSISLSDAKEFAASPFPGRPGAFQSNNWDFGVNPYYLSARDLNIDTKDRFVTLISLNYQFTDWLSLQVRGAQDYSIFDADVIQPIGGNPQAANGTLQNTHSNSTSRTYDAIANLNKRVNDDFSIGANLGVSQNRIFSNQQTVLANNQVVPALFSLNNYENRSSVTNDRDKKINSAFGSVQFAFQESIFLEVTGRNDWSSALPKANNSFFYPSATLSTVISEYLSVDPSLLTFAKIRGSWAQVGNDTNPFNLFTSFIISPDQYNGQTFLFFGNTNSSTPYEGSQYGIIVRNPNLKPEKTTSFEIGADLRFLNNRLSLDLTYYKSNSENQIFPASIPLSTGIQSVVINAGEIENKGIEVAIGANVIDNEGLKWNIGATYSKNESKIIKLAPDLGISRLRVGGHFNNQIESFGTEGNSYGDLVGVTYIRDSGGAIVYDEDGRPSLGPVDVVGNATPDWLMGITNTFTYKSLSLSFLIDIRKGGDIYSFGENLMSSQGVLKTTLVGRDFYTGGNGVMVPEGATVQNAAGEAGQLIEQVADRGVDPSVYWARVAQIAEEWIYDASYVKLRQLTLGYNLPASILNGTPFDKVRISYVARNLAVLHKNTDNIDPESAFSAGNIQGVENFGLPVTSSHGLQLSVTF